MPQCNPFHDPIRFLKNQTLHIGGVLRDMRNWHIHTLLHKILLETLRKNDLHHLIKISFHNQPTLPPTAPGPASKANLRSLPHSEKTVIHISPTTRSVVRSFGENFENRNEENLLHRQLPQLVSNLKTWALQTTIRAFPHSGDRPLHAGA